jgi:hypothetical protein
VAGCEAGGGGDVSDRPDDFIFISLTADGFNELMAKRRAMEAAEEAEFLAGKAAK